MTTQPKPGRMTADEFLAWAARQPDRHELVNGEIVLMAAERARHVIAKGAMFRALADAVESGKLPCDVMVDGMAVRIDETTIYEPDVLVRCGPPLPGYLVVNPEARAVTHYYRGSDGEVVPRLVRSGRLELDPPGVGIDLERVFATR